MHLPALLPHRFIKSRPHLTLALALGVAAGCGAPASYHTVSRILIGWNVGVWTYLPVMAYLMMRAAPGKVREVAERQDESAAVVLIVLLIAAVFSLTAIVTELSGAAPAGASERAARYAFTAATLFGSWFLVGTLFCFHYAHLFYNGGDAVPPVLEFPGCEGQPDYWDFLYFSFTIAVAAQTSDVVVQARGLRKVVLGQSLLSFFFNLAILGLSINIAAGLINH